MTLRLYSGCILLLDSNGSVAFLPFDLSGISAIYSDPDAEADDCSTTQLHYGDYVIDLDLAPDALAQLKPQLSLALKMIAHHAYPPHAASIRPRPRRSSEFSGVFDLADGDDNEFGPMFQRRASAAELTKRGSMDNLWPVSSDGEERPTMLGSARPLLSHVFGAQLEATLLNVGEEEEEGGGEGADTDSVESDVTEYRSEAPGEEEDSTPVHSMCSRQASDVDVRTTGSYIEVEDDVTGHNQGTTLSLCVTSRFFLL